MKTLVLSVFGLLVVVSSLMVAPTGFTQADTSTTHTETQLAANLPNPCNGELVATTALQKDVIHMTTNENGTHLDIHTNLHGTGTGLTTGAEYRLNAVSSASLNIVGAENQTLHQDFIFNGQGSAPNFHVQVVEHITVNANNEIVVDFRRVNVSCN